MIRCSAKQKRFSLIKSIRDLTEICPELPGDNECFKFVSHGGFSSASFIAMVAEYTKINMLYCSTFRVGKKEIIMLNGLHEKCVLDKAKFVMFSGMLGDENKKYNYNEIVNRVCEKNGWMVETKKNHSKIFLFDTDCGKYVLETSSNLNENPKIEQYSFEKSEELYRFYEREIFNA